MTAKQNKETVDACCQVVVAVTVLGVSVDVFVVDVLVEVDVVLVAVVLVAVVLVADVVLVVVTVVLVIVCVVVVNVDVLVFVVGKCVLQDIGFVEQMALPVPVLLSARRLLKTMSSCQSLSLTSAQ